MTRLIKHLVIDKKSSDAHCFKLHHNLIGSNQTFQYCNKLFQGNYNDEINYIAQAVQEQ